MRQNIAKSEPAALRERLTDAAKKYSEVRSDTKRHKLHSVELLNRARTLREQAERLREESCYLIGEPKGRPAL